MAAEFGCPSLHIPRRLDMLALLADPRYFIENAIGHLPTDAIAAASGLVEFAIQQLKDCFHACALLPIEFAASKCQTIAYTAIAAGDREVAALEIKPASDGQPAA